MKPAINPLAPLSIGNLPPELLTRVFQYVHEEEHCLAYQPGYSLGYDRGYPHRWLKFPNQPDRLAHVCSTWRCIALATSSLWTHIDIAIDDSRNHNLFTRARAYAQRAGHHPIEVHLFDPGSERERKRSQAGRLHTSRHDHEDLHEFRFLDADMVPIRSLVLDIMVFNSFRYAHFSALDYFFAKCETRTLSRYITRVGPLAPKFFVEATENPHSPQTNLLQLPRSQLEERWRSVKVVDVNGLCPRWASKLYHGLVDLRLGNNIPEISEHQIVNILKASPGLRILHLKTPVTLQSPSGAAVKRVRLNDLEVLNIEDLESDFDSGEIVRRIQPGTKPLRFTFFGMPTTTVAKFFKRANLTRLYVQGWEPFTLVELLRLAPRLQTLVLNAFNFEVDTIGALVDPIKEKGSLAPPTLVHINTLYLFGFSKLELDDIQEAVDRYSVQRLFLWACDLTCPSQAGGKIGYDDPTGIRRKLSEIQNCPVVEYLNGNDEPINPDDWE